MSDKKVAALITTHIQRYPQIEILDIYKLLHQAVFGPGHAIKAIKSTREWLDREAEILQPGPVQLLLENIHPDEMMIRVHLKPYLEANGSLDKLLDAFVQSSKAVQGDPATMSAWWNVFQSMTDPGAPLADRFESRTVLITGRTKAAENWAASQHSPQFNQVYKPYYRVLTRQNAALLLAQQHIEAHLT